MIPSAARKFDAVVPREAWGGVNAEGFHLYEDARAMLVANSQGPHHPEFGSVEFSVCRIAARAIAVFVPMTIPPAARAAVAALKPIWLDAIVHATLISESGAEIAVIDAEILSLDEADLQLCAFATACIAYTSGSFDVDPESYLIRFATRDAVRVTMSFDERSESWFGTAMMQFIDT